MWDIRISAYCLMPNHYHLLVQTLELNLCANKATYYKKAKRRLDAYELKKMGKLDGKTAIVTGAAGGGSIINISSINGIKAFPGMGLYRAFKAA